MLVRTMCQRTQKQEREKSGNLSVGFFLKRQSILATTATPTVLLNLSKIATAATSCGRTPC